MPSLKENTIGTRVSTPRMLLNRLTLKQYLTVKAAKPAFNVTVHYSFDYAQQVHIPSNPMQPGPIYFKTPRKCGIFGVMCEGLPRQVNFLISAGKGVNATISYAHYYFEHHGLGETDTQLNADNCSGQNKNNYFLWYFAWRTLMKLHHSITYSFPIAGLLRPVLSD